MSKEIISEWRQETIAEDEKHINSEGPAGFLKVESSETGQPGNMTRAVLREIALLDIVSDGEYMDYKMYLKNPGHINWDPIWWKTVKFIS